MRSYFPSAIALMVLASSQLGSAGEPSREAMERFTRNLESAKTFRFGEDGAPLVEIEQLVFTLPRDARARDRIEQDLIAALRSATTPDAQDFLCRQLRVIGTARAVPSLEAILTDAATSSMAIYALGYLECPEAAAALRRALTATRGATQAGIIRALADRRDQESLAQLLLLLGSEDAAVACESARAVGKLGGAEAVAGLRTMRELAGPEFAGAIDHALLECAEAWAAAGNHDEAAAIYEAVRRDQPSPVFQLATLKGLVRTRGAEAVGLLVAAIEQDQGAPAQDAIAMIQWVPGAEATRAFAGLLPSVPPATQVLLLRALGSRGDATATAAIADIAGSDEEPVRLAALEALGRVGGVAELSTLVAAATTEGEVKRVAQTSLRQLTGTDVDSSLMILLEGSEEPMRIAAIDALAGRAATQAVDRLLGASRDPSPAVRQAALRALGVLATPSDVGSLLQLVQQPTSDEDRAVLVAAIGKVLPRCPDPGATLTAMVHALDTGPAAARPALLQLLGKTGVDQALLILRANLQHSSGDVQDAAVLALSEWPDARAIHDLFGVLESTDRAAQRERALTGLVRLAGNSADATELFARMLQCVTQIPDKKLVLASLGTQASSTGALELALANLRDRDLGPTAGVAAVRIANRLKGSQEGTAREALQRVIAQVDHDDVRRRAREVLNELDKYEGHLLQWMAAGPFVEKGKDGAAVYELVFDPERGDAVEVEWQPVTKGLGSWDVNLEATFGGLDHCAAYLRSRIWSPDDADASLELGCDDAVKAWLNGELVYSQWTEHGAAPRQHRAEIQLKQGWNDLMLKVVDQAGGWVVGCRVRTRDGLPIDGLKVSAE